MTAYGDQNMSWQGLRDVARGQVRYWPDGRVNAIYPNGYGLEQYPIFTERYLEWIWRYYLATGDRDTPRAALSHMPDGLLTTCGRTSIPPPGCSKDSTSHPTAIRSMAMTPT